MVNLFRQSPSLSLHRGSTVYFVPAVVNYFVVFFFVHILFMLVCVVLLLVKNK